MINFSNQLREHAEANPNFRPELDTLRRSLDDPSVSRTLAAVRLIAEKILHEVANHKIEKVDRKTLVLDRLIHIARDEIPVGIEIFFRTIQGNANPGCHYQERPLDNSHAVIALTALCEVLDWYGNEYREGRKPNPKDTPQDYLKWIRSQSASGEFSTALRLAATARRLWPDEVALVEVHAELLQKFGATRQAHEATKRYNERHPDNFTSNRIMAELEGDLARMEYPENGDDSEGYLRSISLRSQRLLRQAGDSREQLKAVYCAVNTAGQLLAGGQEDDATELVSKAWRIISGLLATGEEFEEADRCHALTLAGQAAAILSVRDDSKREQAQQFLEQADSLLANDWRSRLRILAPAQHNLKAMGFDGEGQVNLIDLLHAPGVAAFTGHMMDTWTRAEPRFPADMEEEVTAAIADQLERLDIRVGVASGSCGGDLIFLEQVLKRDGEIHIVLPYSMERFREDALQSDFRARTGYQFNSEKGPWTRRFEKVWDKASSRTVLSERCSWDNAMASECSNRATLGLALLKAEILTADPTVLALWNGLPGDKVGGTQSFAEYARKREDRVEIVLLDTLVSPIGEATTPNYPKPEQQICALLFAHVIDFDRIHEREIPQFREVYLKPLAELIESCAEDVVESNSWNGRFFCAFRSPATAGKFALALQALADGIDRSAAGLPQAFDVRISLHAGPVYEMDDPISGKPSCIGTHVVFGADIDSQTPSGRIYTSQAFAALATAEGASPFRCEYVDDVRIGRTMQPQPIYVLHERRSQS